MRLKLPRFGLPAALLTCGMVLMLLTDPRDGPSSEMPWVSTTALAQKAGNKAPSPVEPLAEQDVFYPGTEGLAADEMRVIACGTGMPTVPPKQAAACWLVELGNGDKFLFDIGAQSMSRRGAFYPR